MAEKIGCEKKSFHNQSYGVLNERERIQKCILRRSIL